MKLAQKPGGEAVYKFKMDELKQLAKNAHQEDSPPPTPPPPGNDYSNDYGNDYSDDPTQSGGQKNEASGSLLEKFSKYKPTRTKDGGRKTSFSKTIFLFVIFLV